jgi:hypothetical protein
MRGIPVGKKKEMQDSLLVTGTWCSPLAGRPTRFLGRGDALLFHSAHPIRQRQKEQRPGILPGSAGRCPWGNDCRVGCVAHRSRCCWPPLHMVLPRPKTAISVIRMQPWLVTSAWDDHPEPCEAPDESRDWGLESTGLGGRRHRPFYPCPNNRPAKLARNRPGMRDVQREVVPGSFIAGPRLCARRD